MINLAAGDVVLKSNRFNKRKAWAWKRCIDQLMRFRQFESPKLVKRKTKYTFYFPQPRHHSHSFRNNHSNFFKVRQLICNNVSCRLHMQLSMCMNNNKLAIMSEEREITVRMHDAIGPMPSRKVDIYTSFFSLWNKTNAKIQSYR